MMMFLVRTRTSTPVSTLRSMTSSVVLRSVSSVVLLVPVTGRGVISVEFRSSSFSRYTDLCSIWLDGQLSRGFEWPIRSFSY